MSSPFWPAPKNARLPVMFSFAGQSRSGNGQPSQHYMPFLSSRESVVKGSNCVQLSRSTKSLGLFETAASPMINCMNKVKQFVNTSVAALENEALATFEEKREGDKNHANDNNSYLKGGTNSVVCSVIKSKVAYCGRDMIFMQPLDEPLIVLKHGNPFVCMNCRTKSKYNCVYAGTCSDTGHLKLVFKNQMSRILRYNDRCMLIQSFKIDVINAVISKLNLLVEQSSNPMLASRFCEDVPSFKDKEKGYDASLDAALSRMFARLSIEDHTPNTFGFESFHKTLNRSQIEAVCGILEDNSPMNVIHGPPGTGKTTVLIELLLQLCIKMNKRIICCGPSNKSVDNIILSLLPIINQCNCGICDLCDFRFTRWGHLVRIDSRIHEYCADSLIYELSNDPGFPSKVSERTLKPLLVGHSCAVFTTLSNCALIYKKFRNLEDSLFGTFDFIFIDECGQATEAICWSTLMAGRRAVIFGDHLQLPPTVRSINYSNYNGVKHPLVY